MSHVHALLGQEITWSVPQPPQYAPGSYRSIPQPDLVRTGVVWSHGPVENTAWVLPDERAEDEGTAVCVAVSKAGKHTQRDVDLKRSTIATQAHGLACMRVGGRLPIALADALPSALPRGDGEDPVFSYVGRGVTGGSFRRGEVKARGTCTECSKPRSVKRVETIGRRPDARPDQQGPLLNLAPLVAPHTVKGAACSGAGWPPAETRYTPGRELASWIEVHGKEAVA